MTKVFGREPALIMWAMQVVLGNIAVWGLDLSAGQTASILSITGAILALITRSRVTPAEA